MAKKQLTLPELRLTTNPIEVSLRQFAGKGTVFITDRHNHPKISAFGEAVLIENNCSDQLEKLEATVKGKQVIGVGGCTALDIARICSQNSTQELILIPSILSTACISVNKSIINVDGHNRAVITRSPDLVIVDTSFLLDSEPDQIVKWSSSGYGDYIARVGGILDWIFRTEGKQHVVLAALPELFEIAGDIEYINGSFRSFDGSSLLRLAFFLHKSSLTVITNGPDDHSVGGEHLLYYTLAERQKSYTNERPTHGQLVAMGTLISVAVFRLMGMCPMLDRLERQLFLSFRKLGLPCTYKELEGIGVEREHLIDAILEMTKTDEGRQTLIGHYFSTADRDFHALDAIFGA